MLFDQRCDRSACRSDWISPVVAVCGQRLAPLDAFAGIGVSRVYALNEAEPDIDRCMRSPGPLLEEIGRQVAMDWACSAAPG